MDRDDFGGGIGAGIVNHQNAPSHASAAALAREIRQHAIEARCAIVGADHDIYGGFRRSAQLFRHRRALSKKTGGFGGWPPARVVTEGQPTSLATGYSALRKVHGLQWVRAIRHFTYRHSPVIHLGSRGRDTRIRMP